MIRIAEENDLEDILEIHRLAFGEDDEAELVLALLQDPTAQPCLSLLALEDEEPVGHVLFTKAFVGDSDLSAYLLAPLAIKPDYQFQGTGQRLMREGFRHLAEKGCDLVFVLGDPEYYPRVGFLHDAAAKGFSAPHPIPSEHRDAWMVRSFSNKLAVGKVRVADAISSPDCWVE